MDRPTHLLTLWDRFGNIFYSSDKAASITEHRIRRRDFFYHPASFLARIKLTSIYPFPDAHNYLVIVCCIGRGCHHLKQCMEVEAHEEQSDDQSFQQEKCLIRSNDEWSSFTDLMMDASESMHTNHRRRRRLSLSLSMVLSMVLRCTRTSPLFLRVPT